MPDDIELGEAQPGVPDIDGESGESGEAGAGPTECETTAAEMPEECALDLSFSETSAGEPAAGEPAK